VIEKTSFPFDKIIGIGLVKEKIEVRGVKVSKKARERIEEKGGEVKENQEEGLEETK
jgi:ribosomal protein L15